MKVPRRKLNLPRQNPQPQRARIPPAPLLQRLLNQYTCLFHRALPHIFHHPRRVGLAPLARPEPCCLGLHPRCVETYVCAPREAAGACGPAVDVCGFDRVDEVSVCVCVAECQGEPPCCVGCVGHVWGFERGWMGLVGWGLVVRRVDFAEGGFENVG